MSSPSTSSSSSPSMSSSSSASSSSSPSSSAAAPLLPFSVFCFLWSTSSSSALLFLAFSSSAEGASAATSFLTSASENSPAAQVSRRLPSSLKLNTADTMSDAEVKNDVAAEAPSAEELKAKKRSAEDDEVDHKKQ